MIRSALIVLAAAVAGLLASSAGAGSAGDEPLAAGAVTIVPPPGWERAPAAPGRLGLAGLENAVAAKAPEGRGRMVAGLLPELVFAQDLGSEVAGTAPAPVAVRAGRLEAYRWRDLGDGITLLAAPTSAGAAVVACSGPAAALRACERYAATLEVEGAESSPLDTLAFYGGELEAAFARLERRRAATAPLLAAPRDRDRAAAAAALARAHASAAEAIGALAPPAAAAQAHEHLTSSLRDAEAAYDRLAAARGRTAAEAAREARRAEAALHRAAAGP